MTSVYYYLSVLLLYLALKFTLFLDFIFMGLLW